MAFEAVSINDLTEAEALTGLSFVAGDINGAPFRVPVALFQLLGFIPLAGTEEGSPVTGDISVHEFFNIKSNSNGDNFGIYFDEGSIDISNDGSTNPSNAYSLAFNSDGLFYSNANETSKGIASEQYFTSKTPNTFAQMQDVLNVGGVLAKNFADDVAAASGGVSVGEVYHTAGVVKIRLA